MGKIFTKLGIVSRSQLDRALPADLATVRQPPRPPDAVRPAVSG
ncbi:MAG TPA: hypothetical protein VF951_07395 [Streptosporangiaceae bacterium]